MRYLFGSTEGPKQTREQVCLSKIQIRCSASLCLCLLASGSRPGARGCLSNRARHNAESCFLTNVNHSNKPTCNCVTAYLFASARTKGPVTD